MAKEKSSNKRVSQPQVEINPNPEPEKESREREAIAQREKPLDELGRCFAVSFRRPSPICSRKKR